MMNDEFGYKKRSPREKTKLHNKHLQEIEKEGKSAKNEPNFKLPPDF